MPGSRSERHLRSRGAAGRVEEGCNTETRLLALAHSDRSRPMSDYRSYFSDARFWRTLRDNLQALGLDLVYSALVLYYALQDPSLPGWARAKATGALGYLLFPADAIPDCWPGGYTDDAAVIAAALAAVAMHIDADAKQDARTKLRDWFGDGASEAALLT